MKHANILEEELERRILLLDGGFGTMVQGYGLATTRSSSKGATTCWR